MPKVGTKAIGEGICLVESPHARIVQTQWEVQKDYFSRTIKKIFIA